MIRPMLKKKTIISSKQSNKYDVQISSMAEFIYKKINSGTILSKIPFINNKQSFSLLIHIFNKSVRNQNDLLVIRHFWTTFPNFLNTLNLTKNYNDSQEILHKLSWFVQCEGHKRMEIICINGEIGDKFYMIFKGKVGIWSPVEYKFKLTFDDFMDYLKQWFELKEYDWMGRAIRSNPLVVVSNEVSALAKQAEYLSSQPLKEHETNISVMTYINRIIPQSEGTGPEVDNYILWKYHYICDWECGKNFGDIALKDGNNRRTATIISLTDCYFGTIKKDVYRTCIKDTLERIRKNNIDNILSNRIFYKYNSDTFELYFFNYFKWVTINRSDKLFEQNNERTAVYFIKKGEIEISMANNFSELETIITSWNGVYSDDAMKKKINENMKLRKYYNDTKHFSLYIVKDKDVLGMDDYWLGDKFFATAKCVSQTAEIFSWDLTWFNKIIKEEAMIRQNFLQWIAVRKQVMSERIKSIIDISLWKYYENVYEVNESNWKGQDPVNSSNKREIKRLKKLMNTNTNFSTKWDCEIMRKSWIKEPQHELGENSHYLWTEWDNRKSSNDSKNQMKDKTEDKISNGSKVMTSITSIKSGIKTRNIKKTRFFTSTIGNTQSNTRWINQVYRENISHTPSTHNKIAPRLNLNTILPNVKTISRNTAPLSTEDTARTKRKIKHEDPRFSSDCFRFKSKWTVNKHWKDRFKLYNKVIDKWLDQQTAFNTKREKTNGNEIDCWMFDRYIEKIEKPKGRNVNKTKHKICESWTDFSSRKYFATIGNKAKRRNHSISILNTKNK